MFGQLELELHELAATLSRADLFDLTTCWGRQAA